MRRVTLINLVINLGISLLPMVDIWAHLGGGVAGFALGLVYVYQGEHPRHRIVNVATAIFLSLLAVTCVGLNLKTQRPWELIQPLRLVEQDVGNEGITIGIPSILKKFNENKNVTVFGDADFDPYQITVSSVVFAQVPSTREEVEEELQQAIEATLAQLGLSMADIHIHDINDIPTASSYVALPKGGSYWLWLQFHDKLLVSVEIFAADGTLPNLVQNLDDIVASIKTSIQI
jgi:hypothetical protein